MGTSMTDPEVGRDRRDKRSQVSRDSCDRNLGYLGTDVTRDSRISWERYDRDPEAS